MKYLTKNKHWNVVEDYNLDKLLYILIDRPDKTSYYNDLLWTNDKRQRHRDYDLPVYINFSNVFWCRNDKFDRNNNKPAYISNNGCKQYWINDNFTKEEK